MCFSKWHQKRDSSSELLRSKIMEEQILAGLWPLMLIEAKLEFSVKT